MKIHRNCVLYPPALWIHLALSDCAAGRMMEGAETYRYKSHHMAPLERHQTGAEMAFLTLSSSQVKISSSRRDGGGGSHVQENGHKSEQTVRAFLRNVAFLQDFSLSCQERPRSLSVSHLHSRRRELGSFGPPWCRRIEPSLFPGYLKSRARAPDSRSGYTLTSRCLSSRGEPAESKNKKKM